MATVLVVDDGEDVRRLLKIALERTGYQVLTAANGAEALQSMKARVPCLVLLDLMMPVMNGWDFLNAKNSDPRHAAVPVVVITAAGHVDSVPGAQGFLRKPLDLNSIFEKVGEYCGSAA